VSRRLFSRCFFAFVLYLALPSLVLLPLQTTVLLGRPLELTDVCRMWFKAYCIKLATRKVYILWKWSRDLKVAYKAVYEEWLLTRGLNETRY